VDRNREVPHPTEDKAWWCQHGSDLEARFVKICKDQFGLDAKINPDKATNPYAPDLVVNGVLADLKVQNTPFFTAPRYGLDPRFTVTFNRKDYARYSELYSGIDIYYWIDWAQLAWKDRRVQYLGGVFWAPFKKLAGMIEAGAPEHNYIHRRNDTQGNAKSSFLLDLRSFKPLFQTDKR
jgi:hypothetical protein